MKGIDRGVLNGQLLWLRSRRKRSVFSQALHVKRHVGRDACRAIYTRTKISHLPTRFRTLPNRSPSLQVLKLYMNAIWPRRYYLTPKLELTQDAKRNKEFPLRNLCSTGQKVCCTLLYNFLALYSRCIENRTHF